MTEPGKDPMGISHCFHEVGTHLGFDTEVVLTVAEHSLGRHAEEHYSHHTGKKLVEHTAVDCSRDHDDAADDVHLLLDIHAGLFSSVSCW